MTRLVISCKILLSKYGGLKNKMNNTIYVSPNDWAQGIVKTFNGEVAIPTVSLQTQAQLRSARKVTYVKCAGRVKYKLKDIEEYLQKNEVKAI